MHSDATTWRNRQKSEWCGEFINSGHKTILGLASRFGLTVIDAIAAQPAGSSDTLYFGGRYYPQDQADRDFAPVSAILQQQISAAPSTAYNSYTQAGYRLDHLSVHQWIEKYVPDGHKSQLGRYLDSAYNQEYGLDTRLQSSLNLVYLLGYQPASGPWQIYGESDERYTILGGNQLLPEAIAASLPGGSVITGSALDEHPADAGRGLCPDLQDLGRFEVGGGRRRDPHASLWRAAKAGLFLGGVRRAQANRHSGARVRHEHEAVAAIQQTILGLDRKLGDERRQYLYGFVLSERMGLVARPRRPTGVLTAFMGGSNGASFTGAASPYASAATDGYVRKYAMEFLTQLEKVWPGVSMYWNGLATLSTPWTDPNLLGSYSCWLVGQYTKFAGYERVRQGNCHFAGEHCSINFQGFMEGGARTGARAAQQIIKVDTAAR